MPKDNKIKSEDQSDKQVKASKVLKSENQQLIVIDAFFFSIRVFVSRTLTTHRTSRGREGTILFHSTTSTRSRTFRHLFATLHVR